MKKNIIDKAKKFAITSHKDQKYCIHPYHKHLADVYNILLEFEVQNINLLAASWLHDIIEDTDVTYYELKLHFGKSIADLVYSVTDEPGRNRKERHEKTYPKIAIWSSAKILKSADRLANVRYSYKIGGNKLKMYKSEHDTFVCLTKVKFALTKKDKDKIDIATLNILKEIEEILK